MRFLQNQQSLIKPNFKFQKNQAFKKEQASELKKLCVISHPLFSQNNKKTRLCKKTHAPLN